MISVVDRASIRFITLSRPERLNALDDEALAELRKLLTQTAAARVRCVVLQGSGPHFCVGRDLRSAAQGEDAEQVLLEQVNPVILALHDLPQPTIAAVRGHAMGIGLGLALACDIVIAAEDARFSSPFAKLGAVLDSGATKFLLDRVGLPVVADMVFAARTVAAAEALALGLLSRVVATAELEAQAEAVAARVAEGPAHAFRLQKTLLRQGASHAVEDVLRQEAHAQGVLARGDEYAEGMRAFREKRAPRFGPLVQADQP